VLLALLIMAGTFSYGPAASPPTLNPPIDYVRGLIADTQQFAPDGVTPVYIFSDQEIQMFSQMQAQFGWQSTQFYSPPGGQFLPYAPTAYLRIAATMLRSIAANKARLASIQQLLDVKLDASKAAAALETQAQAYLDMDDNSGAIAIIEWCNDYFSFRDRFWKQVQRQQGV
jgi:hypothetical protein